MRILALAYACEPDEGSEPAAGWWWSQMLGRLGETVAITRANNRGAIEHQTAREGDSRVEYVFVDLPRRATWWKRGQRGVRLYYVLWQLAALREARRLADERPFDLVWHLTLANAWIGSAASLLGIPFVYGPVGGGVRPPLRLVRTLGPRGAFYELLRAAARGMGRYLNPLARLSWRRATLILAQNEETVAWLPRRHRKKAVVFPNIVLDRMPPPRRGEAMNVMLSAGRLLPLKGLTLAIHALALLPGWRLIVYGDGPDAPRLRQLGSDLGLVSALEFRGWAPRAEVLRSMREDASVFVFPSLHDEAGWVVTEALASGLPAVCLDIGGPRDLAIDGMLVTPGSPEDTARRIAEKVRAAEGTDPVLLREHAGQFLFEPRLERVAKLVAAIHDGGRPEGSAG